MSYEEGSKEFEEACTDRAVGLLARNKQLQADLAAAKKHNEELTQTLLLKFNEACQNVLKVLCPEQAKRIAELEKKLIKMIAKNCVDCHGTRKCYRCGGSGQMTTCGFDGQGESESTCCACYDKKTHKATGICQGCKKEIEKVSKGKNGGNET